MPAPPTAVEEILERVVARGAVPGAAFALTGPEGDVSEALAGTLRLDEDEPVTPSTMFRLMSMTKALASVGALQLIERGELRPDAEVASILPEFAELVVLEGFDGDTPRLRIQRGSASIRHLLTHTSGCGYAFQNEDLLRYHEVSGVPDPTAAVRISTPT